MQVSVVVPTYKRPESLRDALASIQNQSRRDLIAEVIVSENGCDEASEGVVKHFTELPIRFTRRFPQLTAGKHIFTAASETKSEWLALLADDDTWGRYHLEEGCRLLNMHPEAHAYACQAANVWSPNRRIQLPTWHTLSSFSTSSSSRYADAWVWDIEQSAVESLIRTPINLWGVIAKKKPYLNALKVFLDENQGIDADRYLLWRLFSQGTTVIGHEATLFYRYHDQSTTNQTFHVNIEHHHAMSAAYTQKIIDDCEQSGIDIKAKWVERFGELSEEDKHGYWNAPLASSGAKAFIQQIWPELVDPYIAKDSIVKSLFRAVSPPVFWDLLRKIKRLGPFRQGS